MLGPVVSFRPGAGRASRSPWRCVLLYVTLPARVVGVSRAAGGPALVQAGDERLSRPLPAAHWLPAGEGVPGRSSFLSRLSRLLAASSLSASAVREMLEVSSGDEAESPLESGTAPESSKRRRRRHKKDKKESESKHHDKSKKRKSRTEENGLSEDDLEPPKLKKMKGRESANGDTGERSPEHKKKSFSLSNGVTPTKTQCNFSEALSGECDSEQEQLQGEIQERKRGRTPKVLVLTPTRELANQVARNFKDITKILSVACFYGGTAYSGQIDLIRSGIDILVGTPGRIKDHLQNGKLDLSKLKHVVLDEVDQMLDMGFAEQVEDILRVAYKKDSEDNPQTLLFSATCPHWVYDVAKKYMKSRYEQVDLIGKRTQKAAVTVEHLAIECHWSQKEAVIGDVIQVYSGSYGRTIVFCETKKEANELALNNSIKQDCQSLHGDIPQNQREITLKGFRNGVFKVLVATNVAARGLDIPEVDLVVQSSPPKDVESYIHRSGRTGRAGRTGMCVCFYQRKEESQLRHVEQKAGITFKRVGVPTATDIIKASSKDAIRCLDSVPQTAIDYFKESAQGLIEEKGAVEALAAALAHISGATSIEQRSLLNSDVGFVTMTLQCSEEINNISYAWRGLREQLGYEIDRKVNRMCLLKGKMGVCFDIPAVDLRQIQGKWQDSKHWHLTVATQLPELAETQREGGRGFYDSRNGRRGPLTYTACVLQELHSWANIPS
ncbi:nucleolar RNA helicase 2-like isoform X3 [Gopherus flavomarginatus]|uniref:nucleolar RNA helicase 2-like isoform X3 n=1 Tax=Gopherus flavomarginatus TaxID=286002 RepID=UPI0021CC2485|nr:nucleolar RNA helicase 2-like isoform X3 [Gopherus flavomarginatus]